MIDYTKILSRRFDAEWTFNGDDYEGLTWLSDSDKPTKKELDDLWPEVLAEIQAEAEQKIAKRNALLDRLGISEEEARILLG